MSLSLKQSHKTTDPLLVMKSNMQYANAPITLTKKLYSQIFAGVATYQIILLYALDLCFIFDDILWCCCFSMNKSDTTL